MDWEKDGEKSAALSEGVRQKNIKNLKKDCKRLDIGGYRVCFGCCILVTGGG